MSVIKFAIIINNFFYINQTSMQPNVLNFRQVIPLQKFSTQDQDSAIEKVDNHCERAPRGLLKVTVKASERMTHSNERSQSMPAAPGANSVLFVLWLQSRICDSLNQDVTTISSYARFSSARSSPREARPVLLPYCRLESRMWFLFVLSRWIRSINLEYAPCVWMCKFQRALI